MIHSLFETLNRRKEDIDLWLHHKMKDQCPLIYSSVDVRNSGFKISVVDTNLFPSGFNNLCATYTEAFHHYFKKYLPAVKNICLIPEEHTRNIYYWENVHVLIKSLQKAGLQAWVGQFGHKPEEDPFEIILKGNNKITVHPLFLRHNNLQSQSQTPEVLLINNDLSTGIPGYLNNPRQVILPSPHLGWHSRRKSRHFFYYNQLIQDLADTIGIDPWLLSPYTTTVYEMDWKDASCLQRLKGTIDDVLKKIQAKYHQYQINEKPYVFIKNNMGTYGMAVQPVFSSNEPLQFNRRQRNKMTSTKGGGGVNEYIIQEGIPTKDFFNNHPLEPVVYLVGGRPVGAFFRINKERNAYDNLNTKGMIFSCLCYHKLEETQKTIELSCEERGDLFRIPSLLGTIATLASQEELKELSWQASPTIPQSALVRRHSHC